MRIKEKAIRKVIVLGLLKKAGKISIEQLAEALSGLGFDLGEQPKWWAHTILKRLHTQGLVEKSEAEEDVSYSVPKNKRTDSYSVTRRAQVVYFEITKKGKERFDYLKRLAEVTLEIEKREKNGKSE